jgi:hypothetical protein
MDRILTFTSQKQLLEALSEKSKHGGGALRGISATDVRGGSFFYRCFKFKRK